MRIGGPLYQAIRDWDLEVEELAAVMIEAGTPPYDAMKIANQEVSRRRREERDQSQREGQ
jgi:hypothetical protein